MDVKTPKHSEWKSYFDVPDTWSSRTDDACTCQIDMSIFVPLSRPPKYRGQAVILLNPLSLHAVYKHVHTSFAIPYRARIPSPPRDSERPNAFPLLASLSFFNVATMPPVPTPTPTERFGPKVRFEQFDSIEPFVQDDSETQRYPSLKVPVLCASSLHVRE